MMIFIHIVAAIFSAQALYKGGLTEAQEWFNIAVLVSAPFGVMFQLRDKEIK